MLTVHSRTFFKAYLECFGARQWGSVSSGGAPSLAVGPYLLFSLVILMTICLCIMKMF